MKSALLQLVFTFLLIFALPSYASEEEDRATAVLMHGRITGVPPDSATLQAMTALLADGDARGAALLATESTAFYNLKLRSMFSAWSNVAGNTNTVLNDMVATLIGIVRDDIPFKEALYGDYLYTARDDLQTEQRSPIDPDGQPMRRNNVDDWCEDGALYPYMANSNEHYHCLQQYGHDLKDSLQQRKQSKVARGHWFKVTEDDRQYDDQRNVVKGRVWWQAVQEGALPLAGIAGILSTRGFAKAYYSAGTNRRATAFVLKYFLCHDMEELHDINVQENFIRQDVSREPGGDHSLFKQRCRGCHAGMDALSGWNVYYDFGVDQVKFRDNGRYLGEQLIYQHGAVQPKITKNVIDPDVGFDYRKEENANDSFKNLWTTGQNSTLGWRGATSGKGAREWGMMIATSKAFSACMATHVYKNVCFSTPESDKEIQARDALAHNFEAEQYNMRKLFADTAAACLVVE
ncbi:MAG: hypothetical protein OYH77_08880 [Pseudomonadota bacterium]|nr:hypothetical protein [Pseudomonadota bacterium]